jgi:hypothetical protein
VLEKSDKIYNQQAYKELMHRKGLNLTMSWAVLAKLRINQQREIVMIDILVRAMRKIVNEEVKMKSIAFVSQHNQSNSLEPTSIRGSVNIGSNGTAASSANTH